ncbi:MAG: hypothetical protein ACFE95_02110 [Candidatus Hodarchaeota archaeon]
MTYIREFLIVHEYGTVIFHRRYYGESKDITIRSGLISAIYSFTAEVENDSIDILRMEKISLIFIKRDLLIFVVFLDSTVNPEFCKNDIDLLANLFFNRFPEVLWQTEIIDLAKFTPFKEDADKFFQELNRKLELILFLIDEGLMSEEEYFEYELGPLGSMIGERLLERKYHQFASALSQDQNSVLSQIDHVLEQLSGEHIERYNMFNFIVNCEKCFICNNNPSNCFYEGLLSSMLTSLRIDYEISFNESD